MGKHGLLSVTLITLIAQLTANTVATALPSSPQSRTNAPNPGNLTRQPASSLDVVLSVELLPQPPLSSSSTLLATAPVLSPTFSSADRLLATLYPYQKEGKDAVTVYVRDLPLVSFVAQPGQEQPLLRASDLVSRLNQLSQGSLGNTTITLDLPQTLANGSELPYRILVNKQELLHFDQGILLGAETDYGNAALQATNGLRRLLLNAPPIALAPLAGPDPVKSQPSDPLKAKPTNPTIPTNLISSLPSQVGQEQGYASWYDLHPSRDELTAAHRTLPIGTKVQVTNLDNGQKTTVRIADRGPFLPGRIIDVSVAAARSLGMIQAGVAKVRLEVLLP